MKTLLALVDYGEPSNTRDWCLVLEPSDWPRILLEHRRVASRLFLTECDDRHLHDAVASGLYPSAIHLGAKWIESILRHGRTVLLNRMGGWFPYEGAKIIREIKGEWPCARETPGEVITITHWQDGSHFYATGHTGKFNSAVEAIAWAKGINPGCVIKESIRRLPS